MREPETTEAIRDLTNIMLWLSETKAKPNRVAAAFERLLKLVGDTNRDIHNRNM